MYSKAHTSFRGQEDYHTDSSSVGFSTECELSWRTGRRQQTKNLGIYKRMHPSEQDYSSSSYNNQRSRQGDRSQRQRFTPRKLSWSEFLTLYLRIKNQFKTSSSTSPSRPSSPSSSSSSCAPITSESDSGISIAASTSVPWRNSKVSSPPRPSSSSSLSSLTTGRDSGISIATNASIPWYNTNMPQKSIENRVPVDKAYPSLRTQNLILSRMQNILEYACFRFAEKSMPDILQITGWTCPEAGELSIWIYHFYEKGKSLQLQDMSRLRGSQISISVLLNSVKEIRHDAVHRNPLDSNYLSLQMSHAVAFCQVLGVSEALDKLQSIQLCAETQIRKLGIITEVNIKFDDVSAQGGLDVHSQAIEETHETFENRRVAACNILDRLLLDPKTIDFSPQEEETPTLEPTAIMTATDITPIAEVEPKERPELSEVASKFFFDSILMMNFFANGLVAVLGSGRSGMEKTAMKVLKAVFLCTIYSLLLFVFIRLVAEISNDLLEYWMSHMGQWVGLCISVYAFCLWMTS
ncbi:hypothetical protein FAVG1_04965 [Fusarium avenaceum]|nr:hypothetical protein FAVG1_04965 [Fusarium avenaceum]